MSFPKINIEEQNTQNRKMLSILHDFLVNQKNDLLYTNRVFDSSDNAYLKLSAPLQGQYLQIQSRLDKVFECSINNYTLSFLTKEDIEWVNEILAYHK